LLNRGIQAAANALNTDRFLTSASSVSDAARAAIPSGHFILLSKKTIS